MEISCKRDGMVDALKFILIVLVVFGHISLIDGFVPIDVTFDELTYSTTRTIYSFHMPLFVFISGMFSKKKGVKETFVNSVKYIRILFLFHIIDILIKYVLIGEVADFRRLITPCFALWYLLDLFYWRILLSLIYTYTNLRCNEVLFISIIVALFVGYIPISSELGFHRFFSFMPFFISGHYYKEKFLGFLHYLNYKINEIFKINMGGRVFSVVSLVSLCYFTSFNPVWLSGLVFPYNNVYEILYTFFSLLLGFCFIFLIFSSFLDCKHFIINKVAPLGRKTLFIYCYHPYVLFLIISFFSKLFEHRISIAGSILVTFITVWILLLMSKSKKLNVVFK